MALPAPEVQLSIGSRFENIELVKVVLDDCLRRLNAEDDVRHWMEMAMREAVANAIKHGNKQDPNKRVTVELAIEGRDLVLQVSDEGEGFDPSHIGDPLQPENRFKKDGRGIFYMRRFMDEVDYSFRPEGGTVVTMRKRIGGPAAGGGDLQEEKS